MVLAYGKSSSAVVFRWTQAASDAARRANVGLYPASSSRVFI